MTIRRSKNPKTTHNLGFRGKKTKLSFRAFIKYLLELNESNPPDGKRLTDDDIGESAKAEFGRNVLSVRNLTNPSSSSSLSTVRAHYNAAQPPLLSIRYNDHGQPCRNYRSPVDIDHLRRKAFRYKIVDPRLFTVDEIGQVMTYMEEYPDDYGDFRLPTKEEMDTHPFGSLEFHPRASDKPKTTLSDLELHNV